MNELYDLFKDFTDLGWNEDTMACLLARFIHAKGLQDDLQSFLKEVAENEREACKEE